MTALLEQALAEMQRLSPAQQDAIAALILEELADDARLGALRSMRQSIRHSVHRPQSNS